jgi:hypothetical protein
MRLCCCCGCCGCCGLCYYLLRFELRLTNDPKICCLCGDQIQANQPRPQLQPRQKEAFSDRRYWTKIASDSGDHETLSKMEADRDYKPWIDPATPEETETDECVLT